MKKEEYDPSDLSIKNAYATRWIWYHSLLALLLLISNIILISILTVLAIRLWAFTEKEKRKTNRQKKITTKLFGKLGLRKRRKKMTNGKGDWQRPVDKKKFDEQFDRIFRKKERKDDKDNSR